MRFSSRFAATLALIGIVSCLRSVAAADDGFEINAVLPLTGSDAALGTAAQSALHTIEVRVNGDGGIGGRPIHFVISDDKSNTARAAQIASVLADQRVPVVIGPARAASCEAMAAILKTNTLLYCLAPAFDPRTATLSFAAGFSTHDSVTAALRYLRAKALTRVAVLTTADGSTPDAERAIDTILTENRDIQLASRERISATATSLTDQVARIKASGAQATIAWLSGAQIGAFFRAAHDANLTMPVVTSEVNQSRALMKTSAKDLPKELLFTSAPSFAVNDIGDKATRDTVESYLAEFSQQGLRPDYGSSVVWDPARIVLAAYFQLGTAVPAEKIRSWIAGQNNWIGISGSYNFRAWAQRGLGVSGVVIVRYDAGQDAWAAVSSPGGRPLSVTP